MYFRYFAGKIIGRILRCFTYVPFYLRRKVEIMVLFFGIKKKSLDEFFESHYSDLFQKSLTPLGEEVVQSDPNRNMILVTGCVNPPAARIAQWLAFDRFYATEFKEMNGRIIGIEVDTFGNLKAAVFPVKKNHHYVYYTDDPDGEKEFCNLMNEVVVV